VTPKQMDQPTTSDFFKKNVELEVLYLIKTLFLQNRSLIGWKFHYGKGGVCGI
jgi:hypothetical protein